MIVVGALRPVRTIDMGNGPHSTLPPCPERRTEEAAA
jgi:hypothetical protein